MNRDLCPAMRRQKLNQKIESKIDIKEIRLIINIETYDGNPDTVNARNIKKP